MEFCPGDTWRKRHAKRPKEYALEMRIPGMRERNRAWYRTEHSVIGNSPGPQRRGGVGPYRNPVGAQDGGFLLAPAVRGIASTAGTSKKDCRLLEAFDLRSRLA